LDQVLAVLKSLAVSANQTIIRSRETPTSVLFLRRGKVSQYRLIRGEPTNIRTFVAPATLFENCIAERSEYQDMLRAATECDFLVLGLDDLTHLMTQNPHEAAALLEACHGERMQSLSMQQVAFRPLVYRVPLVRTVCTSEELAVLTFLFESKVYPAMSIIASKSDICDRIVVLMKGAVSFGVKGKWTIGEAVGYTALVPHRWACSAVAINTCETLELRVDLLRAFLTDSGKLDLATRITEAMLFPIKFEIDAREKYLEEQGVELVPKVRELHRAGRLPVPHRNAVGGFGSEGGVSGGGGAITVHCGGNPHLHSGARSATGRNSVGDAMSARDLGYLVDKVRDDVASLFTPLMHPISPATTRSQSELGFASISKPEMFGVDYFVPNGLFVPHLSTEDRETMVIKAVAAQKRTPFRKMVHITPFLLVKQK
jgi:CRP-like cAMP-binding protein